MKTALVVVALLHLSVAAADPCRRHCREVAAACKARCKLTHPKRGPLRRQCLQICDAGKKDCRASCK